MTRGGGALLQQGIGGLGGQKVADVVDLGVAFEVFFLPLVPGDAGGQDAGVVHQDVDALKALLDGLEDLG